MSERLSKSQRVARQLKGWADNEVQVKNPFADELLVAAKHIEWLELIVTGISHKDRITIAKIERHSKRRDKMLADRNQHISEFKVVIADLKNELKIMEKDWEEEVKGLEAEKRELTPELRDLAEKDFIKNLQTFDQKQRVKRKAYLKGQNERYSDVPRDMGGTAATDGGWQVFPDYQK